MSESSGLKRRVLSSNDVANDKISSKIEILNDQDDKYDNKPIKNSNPLSLSNICWFIASIAAIYYSDIINVLLNNESIHR